MKRNTLIHRCRCAVLSATIPLILGVRAIPQDPGAYNLSPDSNPTPITNADIFDFHQVDSQLYSGGRPREGALPKLVRLGIRTIVNLEGPESAEPERVMIESLNKGLPFELKVDYISFPISPREIEETGVSHRRMRELFGHIRDAKKPIFMHCYLGRDRSAAVVVLYRTLMNQKSISEAYKEAYEFGFSREENGLTLTIDRYKSPKKLHSLPRPEPAK